MLFLLYSVLLWLCGFCVFVVDDYLCVFFFLVRLHSCCFSVTCLYLLYISGGDGFFIIVIVYFCRCGLVVGGAADARHWSGVE